MIHFGLRVEVQQSRDDLGIDLAAVVVARQSRADGRGHRAAGGVVGQLAGHVGRDLRLVPVGHQPTGDEGQHPRLLNSGIGAAVIAAPALLASFAHGGISLDRDVTVAAASTLNATTADITQLTVGSTAPPASPPTWRSSATSGSKRR